MRWTEVSCLRANWFFHWLRSLLAHLRQPVHPQLLRRPGSKRSASTVSVFESVKDFVTAGNGLYSFHSNAFYLSIFQELPGCPGRGRSKSPAHGSPRALVLMCDRITIRIIFESALPNSSRSSGSRLTTPRTTTICRRSYCNPTSSSLRSATEGFGRADILRVGLRKVHISRWMAWRIPGNSHQRRPSRGLRKSKGRR
jgi:hypothetical protein